MADSITGSGAIHFLLLGVSPAPIGGYKVVYEYANVLASRGLSVTIWHSAAYLAEGKGRGRWLALAKAWAYRVINRVQPGPATVSWFPLSDQVQSSITTGLPEPRLKPGDVVIATAIETTPHAARIARDAGARSVALIQHFEEWAASPEYITQAWAQVDARVVIAPWLADKCAAVGLDSVLIPNSIDTARFPLGPSLDERPQRVLSLLSPHSYKRPDVVIGALAEVGRRRPDVELVTFGQSRRLKELPGDIAYVRTPSHEQLCELYQSSRVYLCGSDAEGWHLPPAEATLSGAAVVSTDIGGVRVSMADDAIYARPGDVQGLAAAVLLALDEPAAATQRINRCRERLLARTYQSNTDELLAVLFPSA
jgi:glycosyltransferase involved in cell wall biosynthesis